MLVAISSPTAGSTIPVSTASSGTYTLVMVKKAKTAQTDPSVTTLISLKVSGASLSSPVAVPNVTAGGGNWSAPCFPSSLAGLSGLMLTATLTSGGSTMSASVANISFQASPNPPVPVPPPAKQNKAK